MKKEPLANRMRPTNLDEIVGQEIIIGKGTVLRKRIEKALYPQANIQIDGFENTDFKNNFFDIAIGNVPFGDFKVNDKEYDRNNFLIHDYFFAKTIDKVRNGGIIAFIIFVNSQKLILQLLKLPLQQKEHLHLHS